MLKRKPIGRYDRVVLLLGLAAIGAVLGGCAASDSGGGAGVAEHDAVGVEGGAPSTAPESAPTIAIVPRDGQGYVSLDEPIQVSVDVGVIDQVVVHSDGDSTPLPGQLSTNSSTWKSTGPLDPDTRYLVQATAHDSAGNSTAHTTFSTITPSGRLITSVSPDDSSTVGIGTPIILRFNNSVESDRRANLVAHIDVTATPPVVGAWHWFGDDEVHWRPQNFWTSGTKVVIDARLRGVTIGSNIWGQGDWTSTFTIGDKHLSIIDAAAHTMQVFDNDVLVHTYPVSTGDDKKWPTLSGTLYVHYKSQKVRMVSTSIGIPVNAPGGYDEDVFWDTAISTNGFFIHAAPWSVWAQGHQNVSHGCVNLSTARATEFFNFSNVGDVVIVKNTSRVASADDGEGDWQIPFDQFANSGGSSPSPSPSAAAPTASPSGGGI